MSKAPKGKESKGKVAKIGTPLKDIIPQSIKQPPREAKPIKSAEYIPITQKINEYIAPPIPEDWPGDELAQTMDFGLDLPQPQLFTDQKKFGLPPSFTENNSQIIFWRRAKECLKAEQANNNPLAEPEDRLIHQRKVLKKATSVNQLENDPYFHISKDDIECSSPSQSDKKIDINICLFEIFEREETKEEMEKRKKDSLDKQDKNKKKGGKKEKDDVIEDALIRIKEVKLSNIEFKSDLPMYSKWVSSQLQIIKERNIKDIYSKKPIWSKIYPQKDGVPVLNPNGKYWVKLYHMGKEKKIEIDDKLPANFLGHHLLPRSVNKTEIWPSILTKALMKLNSSRWIPENKTKDLEVGDGSIIYSLTGYIPETIDLSTNWTSKWKAINEYLNDENYQTNGTFVTCYSKPDFKPSAPSNKINNQKDMVLEKAGLAPSESPIKSNAIGSLEDGKPSSFFSGRRPNPSNTFVVNPRSPPALSSTSTIIEPGKGFKVSLKEKPTNVIPGFGYSVIESFENENFNMVYVLKRSEQDLKLRADYINLSKVNMNKMTKEEKLEHRKLKKELKEKVYEEEKRRAELATKPAIQYKFLKIKSSIAKTPQLYFVTPYAWDDIALAKKCILNKLSRPPNSDQLDLRFEDSKSVISQNVSVLNNDTGKLLALDDFSKVPDAKEPLKRANGAWVLDKDFLGCFQYIQVFHDPTKLKNKVMTTYNATEDQEMVAYENSEIILLEAIEGLGEPAQMFIGFNALRAINMSMNPKPFLTIQKYDFQVSKIPYFQCLLKSLIVSLKKKNFCLMQSFKSLAEYIDGDLHYLENKNQVFRLVCVTPISFTLWIASNLNFRLMSISEYLLKLEGYQNKLIPIDYPVIEKDKYHMYYKALIKPLDTNDQLIIRIKSNNDNILIRYLRLKLIEVHDKSYNSTNDINTGIYVNKLEKTKVLTEYARIMIEQNKKYVVVLEGKLPYTNQEGTLELEIIYKNPNFQIETIENVEPLEYMDKYVPYKYGLIFRERLFVNNEVQGTFYLRICDTNGNSVAAQNQKGKKPEINQDIQEIEITQRRLIKFELYSDDKLINYVQGYNKALFSNITLYPTNNPQETRNYYLQASFDLREWPECKELNDATKNLHWILKIVGNDTVAIIKDTQKEDQQKSIKKSWEDNEPGREERSKKARKKYLLAEKRDAGEKLDEAELELLNEPRLRKAQIEELQKAKDPKTKGNQAQKKDSKPAPAKVVVTQKKEDGPGEKKIERNLPKVQDHTMADIRDFLAHMEQPRLMEEVLENDEENTKYEGEVRSLENRNELRENILLGKEEIYGRNSRNAKDREEIKKYINDQKSEIQKKMVNIRNEMKNELQNVMKDRDEIRKKLNNKREKERILVEFCKQEKPVYEDMEKALKEINQNEVNPDLLTLAKKVLKNAMILCKIDKLTTAYNNYEITTCTTLYEEINTLGIIIDESFREKLEERIEEAKRNPAAIAEKQKELQKGPAKGMNGQTMNYNIEFRNQFLIVSVLATLGLIQPQIDIF